MSSDSENVEIKDVDEETEKEVHKSEDEETEKISHKDDDEEIVARKNSVDVQKNSESIIQQLNQKLQEKDEEIKRKDSEIVRLTEEVRALKEDVQHLKEHASNETSSNGTSKPTKTVPTKVATVTPPEKAKQPQKPESQREVSQETAKTEVSSTSKPDDKGGIISELPSLQARKNIFQGSKTPELTKERPTVTGSSIKGIASVFEPKQSIRARSDSPATSDVGESLKARKQAYEKASLETQSTAIPYKSAETLRPKRERKEGEVESKATRSTWSASKFKKIVAEGDIESKCDLCSKTVYATEKIKMDEKVYHRNCLKCSHCGNVLKLGNYASLKGKIYCKPHFKQLFNSKGNYNEGFGEEKLTVQWQQSHEQAATVVS